MSQPGSKGLAKTGSPACVGESDYLGLGEGASLTKNRPTGGHGRVEEGEGLEDGGDHVAFLLVEPKQDLHVIVVFPGSHQNLPLGM